MTGAFQRGLSDAFLDELLCGAAGVVLRACQRRGLDVRLRDDKVNAYHAGRSVALIAWRARKASVEVHRAYLVDGRIGAFGGRASRDNRVFDVDDGFAAAYDEHIDTLIERAKHHMGREENIEFSLMQANSGPGAVFCFDRQIQVSGVRGRLDVMGVRADGSALVAIEVKRYPDPSIQEVPRQLHDYLEVFAPGAGGLRADVAASYRTVCAQLRLLGEPAPEPAFIAAGMPVDGLVVVADYNPRSQLLTRAHALADTLARPIHLWAPAAGDFTIPPPSGWTRMGTAA